MTAQSYQRVAITIPEVMAAQIEQVCKLEGRNRSEFFREAVGNPFESFAEWNSPADSIYDALR